MVHSWKDPLPPENAVIGPLDHIEFYLVRLPFKAPLGTSVASWSAREAIILRLLQNGIVGWGECSADIDPYYDSETNGTAAHIIQDFLLPEVRAELTLGEVMTRFRRVRGHCMAKAAVENALLDLIARREGLPLHQFLGFANKPILSGITIGIQDSIEILLKKTEAAVAIGYHRVKVKIMRGKDIEWMRAVREAFPKLPLMADANGDYTLEHTELLCQLDEFDLTMVEQPLGYHDIYQHSLLQKKMRTPLCLDESIHSLDDAAAAIALGSCRIINIKQGRVGGLLESIRMARLCQASGVPVWSGGMDETGIGRAFNIHMQTADNFIIPGDTSETSLYFKEDIADPPVKLGADGFITIPAGPGTGMTIDPVRLERYTLKRWRYQGQEIK